MKTAFPERHEFDIYASMTPAKAIGGDFHDFFLGDDDHFVKEYAFEDGCNKLSIKKFLSVGK